MNYFYLEKEEERLSKEKEDGKSDKKRKRQRKSKTGSAATAGLYLNFSHTVYFYIFLYLFSVLLKIILGEAVEKVLREKKISNKLNYDVLKSLNMDDFVKSMNFDSQLTGYEMNHVLISIFTFKIFTKK